jgi:hypothetical protein
MMYGVEECVFVVKMFYQTNSFVTVWLFPLGLPQRLLYRTNLHSVQELQAEMEAIAEEIIGKMLCDMVYNLVICL